MNIFIIYLLPIPFPSGALEVVVMEEGEVGMSIGVPMTTGIESEVEVHTRVQDTIVIAAEIERGRERGRGSIGDEILAGLSSHWTAYQVPLFFSFM